MSGNVYADSNFSPRTNVFASAQMLSFAEAVTILPKFALTKPMPKNKTDTIKFRRPVPFSKVTVPLAEGVTPTVNSMTYEDVSATLLEWGDLFGITSKIADTHEDPVLQDMTMLCGDQAEKTLEGIIWGKLVAGTSVFYSNGSARTDVNTPISINDVRKVVRYLQSMKAQKITMILDGSPDFNTTPIEAAYVGFTHTNMQADIRALPGFVPVAQYGSQKTLCPQEFGTVEDVRFITSPEFDAFADAGGLDGNVVLSTTGTSADVYPVVIVGKEAFATVPLKGMGTIVPTILNPDQKDKSDPLGQRGYVGWKTWFIALILNQTWMSRIEAAASEL